MCGLHSTTMSLGLLGQYGESGSESEISDSDDERFRTCGTDPESNKPSPTGNSEPHMEGVSSTEMLTLGTHSYACGDPLDHRTRTSDPESDSGSDSSEEVRSPDPQELKSQSTPLPLPDLGQKISGSVFSNPYKEAEEARLAILKQHVDFDSPKLTTQRLVRKPHGRVCEFRDDGKVLSPGDALFDDKDSSLAQTRGKRKHRSGVGNSLMPSKKVLKMHKQVQAKERPWTIRN